MPSDNRSPWLARNSAWFGTIAQWLSGLAALGTFLAAAYGVSKLAPHFQIQLLREERAALELKILTLGREIDATEPRIKDLIAQRDALYSDIEALLKEKSKLNGTLAASKEVADLLVRFYEHDINMNLNEIERYVLKECGFYVTIVVREGKVISNHDCGKALLMADPLKGVANSVVDTVRARKLLCLLWGATVPIPIVCENLHRVHN